MSDFIPSTDNDYPILKMLMDERIIVAETRCKHLSIQENCDNHFEVILDVDEIRMLADEFERIVDILEKVK